MGAPSTTILETQLKDDLNNICNWISANNLTLNSKKSQLLIIAPNFKFSNVVLNIQSPAGEIKTVFKAKYLGILFDNRLNFLAHIKILEVKIAPLVGILNKLKYFLPSSALLKLYYALIHSHFNYGLAVWGSTYPTYLNKLKLLQNKAIRIVTFSHMSTSSKPLYIKSNILPLPKLFKFEVAKIVYCYKFNLLPKIFDNYLSYAKSYHSRTTRFSLNNHLTIPLFKSNRSQRSIKYIGPKIWNSISHNLRIMTFNKFKKHYKSVLLLND